jgi:hypothetical protein
MYIKRIIFVRPRCEKIAKEEREPVTRGRLFDILLFLKEK